MNVLRVIGSVNPEGGGPIEGIMNSAAILKEHGWSQEIVSLDSPLDPWTKKTPMPLYPMGLRNPRYLAWKQKIPWLRYGYTLLFRGLRKMPAAMTRSSSTDCGIIPRLAPGARWPKAKRLISSSPIKPHRTECGGSCPISRRRWRSSCRANGTSITPPPGALTALSRLEAIPAYGASHLTRFP
jgi:hypothetical protein